MDFQSIYNGIGQKYRDLLDGTLESNCSKPCLKTKVRATLHINFMATTIKLYLQIQGALVSQRFIDNSNLSVFDFTLDPTVTITEAYYPEFDLVSFLSKTGGAVGLWLGLGMVQLVQYVVTGAQMLKKHN